jgi:hypothetical protein
MLKVSVSFSVSTVSQPADRLTADHVSPGEEGSFERDGERPALYDQLMEGIQEREELEDSCPLSHRIGIVFTVDLDQVFPLRKTK